MVPTFSRRVLLGLYSILLWLLLPVTLYHLVWRGFRQREYLLRWDERYAQPQALPALVGAIWVHAVSVGEVNAAVPLVNALRAAYPGRPLLITTITPTGSARVRAIWGDAVHHVYLPYDLHGMVFRFLRQVRPAVGVIVETEIWPNLLVGAARAGVPVVIANARLSPRSLRGYRWLSPLIRIALSGVDVIAAQSEGDAARFRQLAGPGVDIRVTGNLKYDLSLPSEVSGRAHQARQSMGLRPVWVVASSHPDEEPLILAAHRLLRSQWPTALLLWAPRHPERFDAVAGQCAAAGWQVARRTTARLPGQEDAVFVIDTLGELLGFLAMADVAFVGGSLQPVGGHNVLEPAALGLPVLVGPHMFNFAEATALLADVGALQIVRDTDALAEAVGQLFAQPAERVRRGASGRERIARERGAVARTMALVEPLLPKAP